MANTHTSYVLHVQIQGIEPAIWRRLQVEGSVTLRGLHHILQAAFGWTDAHLHAFEVEGTTYARPHKDNTLDRFADASDIQDERKAKLQRLAHRGQHFVYRYDFGDDWLHDVHVEELMQAKQEPGAAAWVVAGERACPPEDVGGIDGYQEMMRVLGSEPNGEQAQSYKAWAGEDFDPELFDRRAANAALLRMAWNDWGRK